MTKVSIKVISVVLCAVMMVGCCFVGCGKTLTREQLLETIKTEFPEAHINEDGVDIYFFSDENTSEYLNLNPQDNLLDYSFYINNLSTLENTKKILNTIMPSFSSDWNNGYTEKFISCANPNEGFTQWNNDSLAGALRIGGWELVPFNSSEAERIDFIAVTPLR